jgi:hypothetical protein
VCERERKRERESRIGLEENSYICSCLLSVEGVCCKQEFQVKSPKEHLLGVVRLAFERERESSRLGLYSAEKSKWVVVACCQLGDVGWYYCRSFLCSVVAVAAAWE